MHIYHALDVGNRTREGKKSLKDILLQLDFFKLASVHPVGTHPITLLICSILLLRTKGQDKYIIQH